VLLLLLGSKRELWAVGVGLALAGLSVHEVVVGMASVIRAVGLGAGCTGSLGRVRAKGVLTGAMGVQGDGVICHGEKELRLLGVATPVA
jgi:hypothetical protein